MSGWWIVAVSSVGSNSMYANVAAVHEPVYVNDAHQDLLSRINTVPGCWFTHVSTSLWWWWQRKTNNNRYRLRLDDKREDYQSCPVLCCASQMCTVINTLISAVLTRDTYRYGWRGGAIGTASDLWFTGCGFESWLDTNLVKLLTPLYLCHQAV